jgi:NhaA family Na+:H+ antiporter
MSSTAASPQFPRPFKTIVRPLEEFLGEETAGGVVLLAAAIAAMIWANTDPGGYIDFWTSAIGGELGPFHLDLSLRDWINDLLMTLFFFVVGLEIKREVLAGELSDRRSASLPVAAAIGGMLAPALIYVAFNAGGDGARGWGIPLATDIAFAIGALSLLGRRVPSSLKAFLLALAIVDDIGGIAVIALFYTDDLAAGWLLAGLAVIFGGVALAVLNVRAVAVYALIAMAAWLAIHESGIHATIAGVLVALIVPVRYGAHASPSSLIDQAEHLLHPVSSYAVVPLFALANAGVDLSVSLVGDSLSSPVSIGIFVGLVLGKPLGITLFSLAAIRFGLAAAPRGVGWDELVGVGLLGGIGFTVSIFIAELSFDDASIIAEAKVGILAASVIAGIAGYIILRFISGRRERAVE